jgi:mono/diheme cytochrome c family protein
MSSKKSTKLLLVGVVVAVLLFVGVSLNNYLNVSKTQNVVVNASMPDADHLALGKKLYVSNCKVCHLEDGSGRFPEFPPLAGSDWALGSAERMIAILLHGLDGKIVVNGKTFSGTMPPFKDRLSYAKIAAILTYVRNAWGNSASSISVEQVKQVAERTKSRKRVWNGAEELLTFDWSS